MPEHIDAPLMNGQVAATPAPVPLAAPPGRALGLVATEGALGVTAVVTLASLFGIDSPAKFEPAATVTATCLAMLGLALLRGIGSKRRAMFAALLVPLAALSFAPSALPAAVMTLLRVAAIVAGAAAVRGAINAHAAAARPLWRGVAATLRQGLTPVLLGGTIALVIWAVTRCETGEKLGEFGGLVVLFVASAGAGKLAAEASVFSSLGGDVTPLERSARLMIGPLVTATATRFALGALGGVILPLGAQILAAGAKNIPPTETATPSVVAACLALACLLPAEVLERRLFYRAAVE
ncbi:MAG: hypothetical protein ACRCT8_14245 [Lacipirellulaceae bacterium]